MSLPPLDRILAAKPWAAPIVDRLRHEVRREVARGARIPAPDEPSGWGHQFVCERCAERLPFDPDRADAFPCPACGIVHDDQARREAWRYFDNLHRITAALDACRIAAWDGDRGARAYALQTLVGYARAYPGLPLHGCRVGQGRIQPQSLCEAVWMLPAVEVFAALRRMEALSGDDAAAVVAMFREAIAVLEPQGGDVHNIHVWIAGAVAALAEAAGDGPARARAEAQLERNLDLGVLPGGSWYECAPHYQFYTAEAFLAYVAAMRALGAEPRFTGRIRALALQPLRLLLPNDDIAGLNDGWPRNPLAARAGFYERADGLVGGCGVAITRCLRAGARRDGVDALIHGPAVLPPDPGALPALDVVDGVAVVRRGGFTALVKANPDGGGHDHPDKPALCLHRADATLDAGDLANPGYGSPLHAGWFRTTAAHNALVIDGADLRQGEAAIRRAEDLGPCTVVEAVHRGAAAGVDIVRTVVIGDGWVVDRLTASADRAHRWCWCFHATADLDGLPGGEPSAILPIPHLVGQRLLPTGDRIDACWRSAAGGRLHVRCWRPDGARFGAARGPALPATRHADLLLVAGAGSSLTVDAVFSLEPLPAERSAGRIAVAGTIIAFAADGRAGLAPG